MKILAHRGLWNIENEKNSAEAIRKALESGYGFESDVRDYCGDMVISHDIADGNSFKAEEVFDWLQEFEDKYTFAINIKADGLKNMLYSLIYQRNIKNYFVFDMSIPQMVEFKEIGLRFFTRQSEVEVHPSMYEDAAGVWIDGFWSTEWITKELLETHIGNNKEICLVSPDLHGKADYTAFWKKIEDYHINTDLIMLCTDHPDEARRFFNE